MYTMINVIDIQGYKATIKYDPVIGKFRGEFITFNGGADFYASNIRNLYEEGDISLKVFLEMCRENRIEQHKNIFRQIQ